MSKFKVGDKVRGIKRDQDAYGRVWTVEQVIENSYEENRYKLKEHHSDNWYDSELELVTKGGTRTMGRRTFKLLKDTPTLRKGAVMQEQCEDGTQPYEVITPELSKDSCTFIIQDRSLVEDQPDWFEEVFPATETWLTKDELDAFKRFITGTSKASVSKPATDRGRNISNGRKRMAQHRRRSEAMKAAWARRKARQ